MIKVKDLSFRYPGNQQETLSHIDLDIEKGDWAVIQGPSGGGKTTLALALAGYLYHYSNGDYEGSVEVNGVPVEEQAFSSIAHEVYLVQQNPENQFCTLTVRDELAFGLENRNEPVDAIEQKISRALEIVHGEALIDANLLELSGGEKQKIAIATAIALSPDIIILDEPTSNLDPIASREVFQALNEMKKVGDITVVIIEHKYQQMLDYTTKSFVLRDGQIKLQKNEQNSTRLFQNEATSFARSPESGKKPLLYLKNFSVNRQAKKVVSVDEMAVYPGEFISVMGPNGSGKTSLMLGLLRILDTTFDQCVLAGRDACELKTYDIARQSGYVFQNPDHQLFCESVEEEVFLAPKNYELNENLIRERVMRIMRGFGLDEKLHIHPFNLSYGQKKRLNLASILSYEPKLLLLDEIFIGQDEENIEFALKILKCYVESHKAAVILINHFVKPLANIANRMIFIEDGKVQFDTPMESYEEDLKAIGKSEYLGGIC